MQGFGFTETQAMLRTEAIRVAQKGLAPGAKYRVYFFDIWPPQYC